MKYSFHKDIHIASIESDSDWHNLCVNTLLQNPEKKQPSINAFLGARYSRSSDSIVDIAKEIYESGKDASKKLETIFYNYGHKSVGDMAQLFLCLENIPMIVAQRFFYLNPVHSGQERSTRYQDFSKPNFLKIPSNIETSAKLRNDYEKIFHKALTNYSELKNQTEIKFSKVFKENTIELSMRSALKARVFDTIRYFIPIGLLTSIGVVMSARAWAERISLYRASKFGIERELGELIYNLLNGTKELEEMGYIPEADTLIRHTEKDNSRNQSVMEILEILRKNLKITKSRQNNSIQFKITTEVNAVNEMLTNYILLLNPYLEMNFSKKYSNTLIKKISKILSQYHDHYHQIGNVAQSGSILIEGITNYGVLKDLLRHRSFEKFIPLLEENVDIETELNRENPYTLCEYLSQKEMKGLKLLFELRMNEHYKSINDWYRQAKKELPIEIANEYIKYLLPHGHITKYKFYASIDDLAYTIGLRTRNGGHIAYRKLTYDWLLQLSKQEPFWNRLKFKLPPVQVDSIQQFWDRS